MKMKANKTRNELKVSDWDTYRLKNEEPTKNDEERRKSFTNFLTETSLKRYGNTSTRFFFTEMCFLPKIAEMHSLGVMNILKQPPSPIYREKGRCLPPRGFLRKISKRIPISKFTQVLSSPPFRTLQKSYGSLTEVFRI